MQKKIHECSENLVSEEALFAVLDVKYIISLNISAHSAKPTFILRKSKGNSYSQTCIILHTGQHSKLARATFVLYMITKRLLSYNCCEITITNFNLFVLSCTQFDETVEKENKSNQRRVKIHRTLTFRKGQNNYIVTSCGDATIYWVQLTSSSLRRLHVALRNLIYFCIKNKSIASTVCAQLFSTITYSESSLNQSDLILIT